MTSASPVIKYFNTTGINKTAGSTCLTFVKLPNPKSSLHSLILMLYKERIYKLAASCAFILSSPKKRADDRSGNPSKVAYCKNFRVFFLALASRAVLLFSAFNVFNMMKM